MKDDARKCGVTSKKEKKGKKENLNKAVLGVKKAWQA